MPLSANVQKNFEKLYNEEADREKLGKKARPRKQIVAIALEAAREHGAKLPGRKKG